MGGLVSARLELPGFLLICYYRRKVMSGPCANPKKCWGHAQPNQRLHVNGLMHIHGSTLSWFSDLLECLEHTYILLKFAVKHMEQAGTKLKIPTPIGTHPLIQGFRKAQIHADRTCSMVFPCYYKAQFPWSHSPATNVNVRELCLSATLTLHDNPHPWIREGTHLHLTC
jgi:hypothetical protein